MGGQHEHDIPAADVVRAVFVEELADGTRSRSSSASSAASACTARTSSRSPPTARTCAVAAWSSSGSASTSTTAPGGQRVRERATPIPPAPHPTSTTTALTFGVVPPGVGLVLVATLESAVGLCLLTGRFLGVAAWLMLVQLLGRCPPCCCSRSAVHRPLVRAHPSRRSTSTFTCPAASCASAPRPRVPRRVAALDPGSRWACRGGRRGAETRTCLPIPAGADGVVQCLLERDSALAHPSLDECGGVRIERNGGAHWWILASPVVML